MAAFWKRRGKRFAKERLPGKRSGYVESDTGAGSIGESVADDDLLDDGLSRVLPAAACAERCKPRRGARFREWIYGVRPEPMPSHIGPVEDPTPGRIGIACSGGGIRSAAFNLGALQALGGKRLRRVDYVAAVSGGSYIAAAFAMVSKRWKGPDRPAVTDDSYDDSDPTALKKMDPFAPGSPEEQYLRNRSQYLAPSGSDRLFLGLRVVLGLLWNLVFLSAPLFVLGLALGATWFRDAHSCRVHSCHAVIHPWMWLGALGLGGLGVAGASWALIRRAPSDRHRQFFQAWSTRLLIAGAAWALLLVAAPALVNFFHDHAVDHTTNQPKPGTSLVGVGGVAGLVAGVAAYVQRAFSTPKTLAEEAGKLRKAFAGLSARLQKFVVLAAGAVLGPALLYSAFVLGSYFALAHSHTGGADDIVVVVAAIVTVLFLVAYYGADITSWSLHPFYKRRLATAFALKRIRAECLDEKELDRVQLVPPVVRDTPDVGTALERDYDRSVPLSKTHQEGWPTLLVCAAANVSNPGATPPGRRVTSFTFSARCIGGPLIGGASTKEYEDAVGSGNPTLYARALARIFNKPHLLDSRRQRDLSLLAAVAMSGAAVSPSMGKMTNPPLRFLIALANIRLGVWLPNPRTVLLNKHQEEQTHEGRVKRSVARVRGRARHVAFGRPRPSYLISELIGRNRVDDRFLYVTDGGHYENLGLVELLRRGCTRIYCFDASGSSTFKELGDAIALARSELGVKVEIDPRELLTDAKTGVAKKDTVLSKFTYPDGTEGTLVYAHNVLTDPSEPPSPGDAPWDVHAYHAVDPNFPHNSTADQLYTDQKFEGYRVLGEVAGKRALALMDTSTPTEDVQPPSTARVQKGSREDPNL